MTVKDVTARVSEWAKDIDMPEGQMIRLINEVEKKLWDNAVSKRVTGMEYAEHHDIEDKLICGEEYGDVYVHYILATAYMRLYESERATQHTALYNGLYSSFCDWVVREYPPVPCAKITV